jgi:hypothetical protein
MEMKRHQIAYLIVLALFVLAPVQAEATSHFLAQLCAKMLTCAPFALAPKIAQADSPVTPGGYVLIQGSGFGHTEGEFYLTGLWEHPVGDELATAKSVKLTIPKGPGWDFWTPTLVFGQVPDNITRVRDQQVKLRIKTATNLWSNEYPVKFKATRDIKRLSSTDPAVKNPPECGTGSNYDTCNSWVDSDDTGEFVWYGCGADETFCGYHENCWGCVGNDEGIDVFSASLKNDWVFDFKDFDRWRSGAGAGDAFFSPISPPFPKGGTSWTPVIKWWVTSDDAVSYDITVDITGPKGVPWK